MIIGSVGSGKSSLMWAMLGEMKQVAGTLSVYKLAIDCHMISAIPFIIHASFITSRQFQENSVTFLHE
jgi:ABC-type Mn2+/Zn2+ transport system ATPase subunit